MKIKDIDGITQIISAGSVDGVLATAGFLRALNINASDIKAVNITWTQAHMVDKVKIDWAEKQVVAFIDLAVNNANPQMTADFVKRITDLGHKIVVIADEHNKDGWEKIVDVSQLMILPQSRADCVNTSASKILKNAFFDQHLLNLLDAGDEADNSTQTTNKYAVMVRETIMSSVMDTSRRTYLATHLAFNLEQDEKITGWRHEYALMEEHKPLILAKREELGKGVARYDANSVGIHDATAIFGGAYALGDKVVVLRSMRDGKAVVTIAKSDRAPDVKALDLTKVLVDNKVPHLGGMAARMNVAPDQEHAAIQAILSAL